MTPRRLPRPEFFHGDIVYLTTDPDQLPRIVKGLCYLTPTEVDYKLAHADREPTWHHGYEISKEPKAPRPTAGFGHRP